uniref:Uncharacterized protein n=1 Tax=Tanacetum cinerariifolium TaxID=118510 RepID=A0A699KND9_TANCI|nr:hypothetical protein [Tanacetum cinerariifolium]
MAPPSLAPTAPQNDGVVKDPQNQVTDSSSSLATVMQKQNGTDFTIEENDVLIRTHEIYSNRWTRIAEFLPGRSDSMIKNQWQVLTSLRSKNVNAGVSSSSAYNRHVSVDSANNSSGSTISLFGKSFAINEDKSFPCMNKPPSPSGVTVAYHGDWIVGTSTVMPSTVVAPPAQPKFIDFLGVGNQ